jgi:hypothetical protein
MSLSLYNCSIPVFIHSLANLKALLEAGAQYGAEQGIDDTVLTSARLFPNMLPLTKQVQIACDIAKRGAARMAGIEAPTDEDTETTFDQLKARVETTKTFLATIQAEAINGTEDNSITMQAGPNMYTFTARDYLNLWALPNLYFHVSTTYNLLRHNGVAIGKADFLGAGAFKSTPVS